MEKFKKICKQAGGAFLCYFVICFFGAYESYYRNENLHFTAVLAAIVSLIIIIGAIVSLIKKNYDPNRYNTIMFISLSLALIVQIIVQGALFYKYRIFLIVGSYILFNLIGVFIVLFNNNIIFRKNETARFIIGEIGIVITGLVAILTCVGKAFSGRRGKYLFDAMEVSNNVNFFWLIILFLTCMFGMVGSIGLTSVIIKKKIGHVK